jgi:hypothetical protein
MKFELEHVRYMPPVLQPGVLYVSEEFATAAHLCACGCGAKIRTPLGPTEWEVNDTPDGPSLWPSVGNWQRPCRSHYVISRGDVRWAEQWTDAEVARGREREQSRREAHFEEMYRPAPGWLRRFWRRLRTLV